MLGGRMKAAGALAGLVAADLLTKWLALALLRADELVERKALFQLVLNVNEQGLGTWAVGLHFDQKYQQLGRTAFGYFALTLAVALLHARGVSPWRRVATYVVSYVAGCVVGIGVGHFVGAFSLHGPYSFPD
jgi:hypothetical protein